MCEGDGALTGCISVLMYMCEWVGGGRGERERDGWGMREREGLVWNKKGTQILCFFASSINYSHIHPALLFTMDSNLDFNQKVFVLICLSAVQNTFMESANNQAVLKYINIIMNYLWYAHWSSFWFCKLFYIWLTFYSCFSFFSPDMVMHSHIRLFFYLPSHPPSCC